MKKPIHVCVVTTAHPVDDVRVNHKFVRSFLGDGLRVTWVGPSHAFFDTSQVHKDGVRFELTRPINNRMGRLLSYRSVYQKALPVSDVDVYYAPEPDSAEVALRLSQKNGAKVIFDIHEVYHGPMLDRWLMGCRAPLIRNYVRRRVSRVCKKCDMVIGVSDAVLSSYVSPDARHLVVRSCAPKWFAEGLAAEVCTDPSSLRMMHGKAALERGTHQVLDALKIAAEADRGLRAVMFAQGSVVDGPQATALRARASELHIEDLLDLRGGVPMQEMPAILRSCDVGLIAYGRSLGADSLPNRLFEYLAIGLPVIAPIYAIEIAKIINSEDCGLLVDFEDPASIASAMVRFRQNPTMCREMGKRARDGFLKRHNFETEVRPVLDAIHNWYPEGGRN